jgi:hypothetical protein
MYFTEEWIGSGRPITRPPHSPEFAPFDFLFRGCIKGAVYVPPLATTVLLLIGWVRGVVPTITLDLLNDVWTDTNTDILCAGPLTVSSLTIHKM